MKWICLGLAALALTGCASSRCTGDAFLRIGVPERTDRVWKLPYPEYAYEHAVIASRCSAARGRPIAILERGTDRFIGIAEKKMGFAQEGNAGPELDRFDSLNELSVSPRTPCSPSDLASVKERHGIERIRGRRIFATQIDVSIPQELEFSSSTMLRCLRSKGPIVWLTPDGKLVAVYDDDRIDTFGR